MSCQHEVKNKNFQGNERTCNEETSIKENPSTKQFQLIKNTKVLKAKRHLHAPLK